MPAPLAALAPYIIGAVGTVGGIIAQNRSNRKLADLQHRRNIQMWNKQNEYNAPEQQMARFKSAGLNPQMIYDKGTAGNAQTMPQYQSIANPNIGNALGQSIAGISGIIQLEKQGIEVDSAKLDLMFEQTFKMELGQLTREQAIVNLTKDQLQIAEKIINNEIERIKLNLWKDNINPNDSIYIKEIVGLLKDLVNKTPQATQFVKENYQNVMDIGNQIINRAKQGVEYHKTNAQWMVEDTIEALKNAMETLKNRMDW